MGLRQGLTPFWRKATMDSCRASAAAVSKSVGGGLGTGEVVPLGGALRRDLLAALDGVGGEVLEGEQRLLGEAARPLEVLQCDEVLLVHLWRRVGGKEGGRQAKQKKLLWGRYRWATTTMNNK